MGATSSTLGVIAIETFKNPFQIPGETTTGDPYIMRYNGAYYFYKTSQIHKAVCAWKSDNMVDFTDFHIVCTEPQASGAYAPEVHYVNGRFYMVTSSRGNGHFMYVSDDPFGPFHCITGRFGQRIDGTLFLDDDGTEYFLRAENGGIQYHHVPAPEKIELSAYPIKESDLNGWTEGPLILRRGKYYFLTYTGNHLMSRGYRISYSVSETSPVQRYVNMNENTLLLEVEDEFHALGHSSSALAPDLDGAYIAYHNYNFLAEPKHRTVNLDRLFFNGARMYCNTAWWPQRKPDLPRFACRGVGELKVEGDIAYLPAIPGERYTAEFNFDLGDGARIVYGDGVIDVGAAGVSVAESEKIIAMARLPKNTSLNKNMTLRLARRADGYMALTLNVGQNLLSWTSALAPGRLGITAKKAAADKYFALSNEAFGSSDRLIPKAVPGRFDAVHALEAPVGVGVRENGMEVFAVQMEAGQRLTFPINVRRAGKYALAALVHTKDVAFRVESDGARCDMRGQMQAADHDGRSWVTLGEISLKGNEGQITLTAQDAALVDSFRLFESDAVEPGEYIRDCELVKPFHIIGEKGEESMISKVYGYSSSEGPNFAFAGRDGWRDYRVKARVHVLKQGDGFASVLLRATKESWYAHQVKESVNALEIRVDAKGVQVNRLNYGSVPLAAMALDIDEGFIDMVCEIRGNTLKVELDGVGELTLKLPMPPYSGKLGMRFDTESFGFESLSVERV